MIKELIENSRRWKSDNIENNQTATIIYPNWSFTLKWKEIKVGHIVEIHQNEFFPADLLLIKSSNDNNTCYVETKNLDGETNLKHKSVPIGMPLDSGYFIECELPNANLYEFKGTLIHGNERIPLGID